MAGDVHDIVEVFEPVLFAEKEERADRFRAFNVTDLGEEAPLVGVGDGVYEAFVIDDVYGDYTIALGSFNVSGK